MNPENATPTNTATFALRGMGGKSRVIVTAIAGVVAICAIAAIVAFAIRTGRELQVASIVIALFGFLVSLRWPLVPLFVLAVLIPFEEVVVISDLGSLSRYASIMFIVAYGIPRLGRLTFRAMPVAGWGYIAWAVFSANWAIDPAASFDRIPVVVLLFVDTVLLASLVVDRPTVIRPLLWAYSLSAAATAVLGIGVLVAAGGLVGQGERVAGLADQDPAYFAAILVPALVFGLYEFLYVRWLVPSAVVIFVCTVGIVISGTRGAWLSVVVVVTLFILPRLEPVRRVAAIAVVLALLMLTLQIPGVADLVGERTDTALSTGGAGRTDIWTIGLRIFDSAPWTGVGLANFQIANTPELAREVTISARSGTAVTSLVAHNIVIGTLAELGAVGTVLLGVFLIPLALRRGWGPEAAVVQAALASLVIVALFIDLTGRKEFWLFIGLACGLTYLARREASRPRRQTVLHAFGQSQTE
jgi:O-antigen ligase